MIQNTAVTSSATHYILNSEFSCDKSNKPTIDLPPLLQLAPLFREFGLKPLG